MKMAVFWVVALSSGMVILSNNFNFETYFRFVPKVC
jgi:hypothetical protein